MKAFILGLINFFVRAITYWRDLFIEVYTFIVFRNAALANVSVLNQYDMRVDYLGRIYTVINLPEELYDRYESEQQAYVLDALAQMSPIINQLNLTDIAFPQFQRVDQTAFLVILWPEWSALSLTKIIFNLIRLAIVIYLGILAFALSQIYLPEMGVYIQELIELLKRPLNLL